MNDQSPDLQSGPLASGESGAARLERETLAGLDLRGRDLRAIEGLRPVDLAGADLTDARLPDGFTFEAGLAQVAEIAVNARKVFIGLLLGCVYAALTIGTTTDVALVVNTASLPLPIIDTPVPVAGFYTVGALILAAVYGYFHFYL